LSEKNKIKLGPLLGMEGDYFYTVTFLSDVDLQTEDIILNLTTHHPEDTKFIQCGFKETLNNSFIYKFGFEVKKRKENYIVNYSISNKEIVFTTEHRNSWKFEVPGEKVIPKIGIASCNGAGNRWPDPKNCNQFSMWTRLRNKFVLDGDDHEIKPFHCLLLTGDQIYADLLWKEIDYFKKHHLIGWRSFLGSSRKFKSHKIANEDKQGLEAQLYDFYEKVYILSWGQIDIATTLASVPSIMMWDDHDIFDGWGSHSEKLQNSEIFQLIFKVAKDFFEKLQIRGNNNKTRIYSKKNTESNHYSTRLSFRNFEILALDNRSQRTREQIMSEEQYEELNALCGDPTFFSNATKELLNTQQTILFVIPVPVAHLNYSSRAESFLSYISKVNFQHNLSLGDDALDHWGHKSHDKEQKYLIDLIYKFGEVFNPKYIHIISGDVHSAGVGRIKKLKSEAVGKKDINGKDYLRVNQLVSSAIVHDPAPKFVQIGIDRITKQTQDVEGYDIWLDDYGKQDMPKTIYDRNFAYLEKRENQGLKFYLELENFTSSTGKEHDRIKTADYNFEQPPQFENSTAKDEQK